MGGMGMGMNMSMSSFQPFSPSVMPSSLLREFDGNTHAQSFISPSTLLSPAPAPSKELALEASAQGKATGTGLDGLVSGFEQMGVSPPGQGKEGEEKGKMGKIGGEEVGDTVQGKGTGVVEGKQT